MLENLEQRLALTTFYVDPTGSDTGTGATDAPWQTLQHAADRVEAGDTVVVRPGSYAGFYLETDGTAAAPITFRAEHAALGTARDALIDRPNGQTSDGINLEGADYVVIEGFSVVGMPRAGIRAVLNQHVTIRDNYTDRNGYWGIFTGFSDDLLVENNLVTNSVREHGIYVSNSGDRPIIRGNALRDNFANGIHLNGDSSQGGDGVITGALIDGNEVSRNGRGGGSGINADGLQDSRIQNNLLIDNHASGISLYRIDGGAPSTGNVVANNTVVQAADARWALNIRDGSTGNTVINNIFMSYHESRGAMSVSADSLPGLESDYNAVINRFTTDDGDSRLTLAAWQAATGQDAHSFVATPEQLFRRTPSAYSHDFYPKPWSPAVDAGRSEGAPTNTIYGGERPVGLAPDLGAFEFVYREMYCDANFDGRTDLTDFGILKSNFGKLGGFAQGDFDGSGRVDLTDFGLIKEMFDPASPLDSQLLLGLAMARALDE